MSSSSGGSIILLGSDVPSSSSSLDSCFDWLSSFCGVVVEGWETLGSGFISELSTQVQLSTQSSWNICKKKKQSILIN